MPKKPFVSIFLVNPKQLNLFAGLACAVITGCAGTSQRADAEKRDLIEKKVFEEVLSCADGISADKWIQAELVAKLRLLKTTPDFESQARTVANETVQAFLAIKLPEKERVEAYEAYLECVSDQLIREVDRKK